MTHNRQLTLRGQAGARGVSAITATINQLPSWTTHSGTCRVTSPLRAEEALMVHQVIEGGRSAYIQLAETHAPTLSRYIARMLSDATKAEDIRQETLLRLWTHADGWRPEIAALSTWLHRIAHNLTIDPLMHDSSRYEFFAQYQRQRRSSDSPMPAETRHQLPSYFMRVMNETLQQT